MYKNRKLILGVAPTRRDYFTNETVEANRDRILSVTRELCAQYDVQMVGIEGLSPDGMMSDIHTADRIIQRFREQGVNALFIPHCNFGQEETVLRLGRAMQVPLLLWGERDEAPNGFAWRTTDTQCGLFASGKALYRGGVPFTYIENCMMDDMAFRDGFRDFLTAARIVANLRGTRIAQISVRPQPFLSVMINESELLERFGFEVIPAPATQILSATKALADTPEAKAVLEGYTAAGVDTSRMDQQSLRNMAGLELAIEQFAAENGCSSVVSECWNIFGESLGIRPCAVFGNLIDKGALAGSFRSYPIQVTGTSSQSEWDEMTITLNSYILADGIAADQTAKTDARGKVVFDNLTAGIYLVSSVRTEQDGKYYVFESFLAAVPGVDSEGQWVYSVSARPKMSVHTPAKGEVTYKAVKAWRDGGQDRPVSVSVEVRRDGQLQQSVTLSAENNWMYTWKAVDDGSVWTVNEVNVPEGYTVGIQRSGDTFSITNTKPETPAGNHPQTGDTTNMTLYVLLMAASGLALLVVGIVLRKKSRAK